MSEGPQSELDDLPAAVPARTLWGRLPLVWILPAVVVLVGGFVVVREKLAQGTAIEIRFQNAEGLEANKTKIRYKDVEIGEVNDIRVGEDRKEVIVTANIHRNAAAYLVADTRFWVVRPRVTGAGVSGLGTLVSGAYISVDVGHLASKVDQFVGLEAPPIVTSDLPGRAFVLHADDLGLAGHWLRGLLSAYRRRPSRGLYPGPRRAPESPSKYSSMPRLIPMSRAPRDSGRQAESTCRSMRTGCGCAPNP